MPHRSARPGCSRSHSAAMPHANTGLSDTSTTELATVVNRSDAIQDQKWSARSSPDNVIKGSRERGVGSRVRCEVLLPAPGSLLPSSTARLPVTGRTSASRQNAIATAGAVANRTIGPAYVVASTATMSTSRGGIGGGNPPPPPPPPTRRGGGGGGGVVGGGAVAGHKSRGREGPPPQSTPQPLLYC